ncbi:hypothetical protein BD770DRAFT_381887 [Pilaira anomala]|nr:hypothetical protein BD770DRAFT_381887 [Pilaira anomala]
MRTAAPTHPTATQTSTVFKRIHVQAKAAKLSRSQISAASIKAVGDQAECSTSLLRSVNDVESEKEYSTEGEQNDEIDGNTNDQDISRQLTVLISEFVSKLREMAIMKLLNPKQKIGDIHTSGQDENADLKYILHKNVYSILKKDKVNCVSMELIKLSLSNILNFASPEMRDVYNGLVSPEEMKEINCTRKQKKDLIAHDKSMNVEIKKLLDELRPHAMKGDACQLRTKIDELKYKETDKLSAKYQLLNVVEII